MPSSQSPTHAVPALRTARAVRVREDGCDVWSRGDTRSVGFAPMFPTPRTERVSPGHLVAVAQGADGIELVVWRWYDAVVLGAADDGGVCLWEPAHGEVVAKARGSYQEQEPGSRAYASAGLPGADWWVAGVANGTPSGDEIDLDDVAGFFTERGLWSAVFRPGS